MDLSLIYYLYHSSWPFKPYGIFIFKSQKNGRKVPDA